MADAAAHYSHMASVFAGVTLADRLQLATHDIRVVNNFVKAVVLDVCARALSGRALRVADVACGRGQDFAKLMYAAEAARTHVAALYGVDVSEGAIEQATATMAAKYASSATVVALVAADARTDAAYGHIPDGGANIVTCQLALHYFFDAATSLDTFFRNAARVCADDGFVVVSFTDGRAVVRRARDTAPDADGIVRFRSGLYGFDIPATHVARYVPGPYGLQYVFHLVESVHGVPEYLAHEGCVIQAAVRHGFKPMCHSYAFDAAACSWAAMPRYATLRARMARGEAVPASFPAAALDAANLYRIVVFAKSSTAIAAWASALIA
jgi:SAM-dependent methyltransferase